MKIIINLGKNKFKKDRPNEVKWNTYVQRWQCNKYLDSGCVGLSVLIIIICFSSERTRKAHMEKNRKQTKMPDYRSYNNFLLYWIQYIGFLDFFSLLRNTCMLSSATYHIHRRHFNLLNGHYIFSAFIILLLLVYVCVVEPNNSIGTCLYRNTAYSQPENEQTRPVGSATETRREK